MGNIAWLQVFIALAIGVFFGASIKSGLASLKAKAGGG